jgi:beta-carotene 3-hydroxylase
MHEILTHQRIKLYGKEKNKYLLSLRRVHKIHDKHLGKHDGESFEMLWLPMKSLKQNN